MSIGKVLLPCYIISVPFASGRVSLVCIATNVRSKILQKYLPIGLGVGLLMVAGILLLVCHGRQIMNDLANARVNRIKRRYVSVLSLPVLRHAWQDRHKQRSQMPHCTCTDLLDITFCAEINLQMTVCSSGCQVKHQITCGAFVSTLSIPAHCLDLSYTMHMLS